MDYWRRREEIKPRTLISNYAKRIHIVPAPFKLRRKKGVSAIIHARDEPWMEPCLLSISDVVDEIIVVDASS
ncbi:MAG: hypothetical protein JSV51_09465, partial [Candidatus Bathyarchaeota archaeon]